MMKGTYCLVIDVPTSVTLRVGSLGRILFRAGTYVYVGSALGGIEQRVRRHRTRQKKLRWHIDYLLSKAQILTTVCLSSLSKDMECRVAAILLGLEGATTPVARFGSSDCRCPAHLVFFGDLDPEWVAETLVMQLSMLGSVYPPKCDRTYPVHTH